MSAAAPVSRSVWQTLILALFATLVLSWSAVELATWNTQFSAIGWNLSPTGTVSYVTRGGGAARAFVVVGDKINWPTLSLLGRANTILVQQVFADTDLTVHLVRAGRSSTVTIRARPWPKAFNDVQHVSHLVSQFFCLFAIGLVYLRPTRVTWAFLLSALFFALPTALVSWGHLSLANYLSANCGSALIRGMSCAAILIFMCRFPSDRPLGPLRVLDATAPSIGVVVAAIGLYVTLDLAFASTQPAAWLVFADQSVIDIAITALALAALVTSFSLTTGSDRQRVIPVLMAYIAFVATRTASQLYRAAYTDATGSAILMAFTALAMIALAAAVAYGVIRHRVIDISFAVSRTLVFSILTGIVLGSFELLNFLSSQFLHEFRLAVLLEAALAIVFGVWLNALHNRVDRFVDRVLFRRRHVAEARLERAANTLGHAETSKFIDEALVVEPLEAFSLASAAVFRDCGNEIYVRTYGRGWDGALCDRFTADDHLVVSLRAELEPIEMNSIRCAQGALPSGLEHPLIAVPFVARHEVLGFALYGGHSGGEAIDADEKRALMQLCAAAAAAYEHIHADELSNQANALRVENTVLQRETALLREVVDSFRSVESSVKT